MWHINGISIVFLWHLYALEMVGFLCRLKIFGLGIYVPLK
jgi:hypothetical protein